MASKKNLQKQITQMQKQFTAPGMSGDPSTARMFGPLMQSNTGLRVTPWTALGSTTVLACIRAISEDIARLPIYIQKQTSGGWVIDSEHQLTSVLRRPNKWHNSFDFFAYLASCYAHRGNGYAVILRSAYGIPIGLIPISPDRVQVLLSDSGSLYYQVSHQLIDSTDQTLITSDDMLHIRGLSLDGYTGVSPLMVGQEAIGLALAAQTHGAKTFSNGASLSGVLEAPETLSNEAAKRMAASWRDAHTGVQNAGRVAVLEEGVKFNNISMTLEEAQFLATRGYQVIDLCRLYRVPPHKVMVLDDAHYANIEQMNQQYIDDTLSPVCIRIEQEMRYKLLMATEQNAYRIAFNFDEMLRSDQSTRYNTYKNATASGVLSINECRKLENLPPVEGGDDHRLQIQNQPINSPALDGTDQQPPPTAPAVPKLSSSRSHNGSKHKDS